MIVGPYVYLIVFFVEMNDIHEHYESDRGQNDEAVDWVVLRKKNIKLLIKSFDAS